MKMRQTLKTIIYWTLNLLDIIVPSKKASILLYHDIGDSKLKLTVSVESFKEQIEFLKRNHYRVIPLSSLVDALEERRYIPPRTVVVTFDDGYLSHYETVMGILEENKIHATFFIATQSIGSTLNNSERKPQRILSDEQIVELEKSPYADIQPHSHTHVEFTKISKAKIREEIEKSRNILESLLNKRCEYFAYPRGQYNSQAVAVVKETNMRAAVTVDERLVGEREDIYALPRHTIHSGTNLIEFKGKLSRAAMFVSKMKGGEPRNETTARNMKNSKI